MQNLTNEDYINNSINLINKIKNNEITFNNEEKAMLLVELEETLSNYKNAINNKNKKEMYCCEVKIDSVNEIIEEYIKEKTINDKYTLEEALECYIKDYYMTPFEMKELSKCNRTIKRKGRYAMFLSFIVAMNALAVASLKTSDSRNTINEVKCSIEEYNTYTDETKEYEEYRNDSVKVGDVIYTYNSEVKQKRNEDKRSIANYYFNSSNIDLKDLSSIEFSNSNNTYSVREDNFDIQEEYKTVNRVLSIDENDKLSYVDMKAKKKDNIIMIIESIFVTALNIQAILSERKAKKACKRYKEATINTLFDEDETPKILIKTANKF